MAFNKVNPSASENQTVINSISFFVKSFKFPQPRNLPLFHLRLFYFLLVEKSGASNNDMDQPYDKIDSSLRMFSLRQSLDYIISVVERMSGFDQIIANNLLNKISEILIIEDNQNVNLYLESEIHRLNRIMDSFPEFLFRWEGNVLFPSDLFYQIITCIEGEYCLRDNISDADLSDDLLVGLRDFLIACVLRDFLINLKLFKATYTKKEVLLRIYESLVHVDKLLGYRLSFILDLKEISVSDLNCSDIRYLLAILDDLSYRPAQYYNYAVKITLRTTVLRIVNVLEEYGFFFNREKISRNLDSFLKRHPEFADLIKIRDFHGQLGSFGWRGVVEDRLGDSLFQWNPIRLIFSFEDAMIRSGALCVKLLNVN